MGDFVEMKITTYVVAKTNQRLFGLQGIYGISVFVLSLVDFKNSLTNSTQVITTSLELLLGLISVVPYYRALDTLEEIANPLRSQPTNL
jgi:hypothetical protein